VSKAGVLVSVAGVLASKADVLVSINFVACRSVSKGSKANDNAIAPRSLKVQLTCAELLYKNKAEILAI